MIYLDVTLRRHQTWLDNSLFTSMTFPARNLYLDSSGPSYPCFISAGVYSFAFPTENLPFNWSI